MISKSISSLPSLGLPISGLYLPCSLTHLRTWCDDSEQVKVCTTSRGWTFGISQRLLDQDGLGLVRCKKKNLEHPHVHGNVRFVTFRDISGSIPHHSSYYGCALKISADINKDRWRAKMCQTTRKWNGFPTVVELLQWTHILSNLSVTGQRLMGLTGMASRCYAVENVRSGRPTVLSQIEHRGSRNEKGQNVNNLTTLQDESHWGKSK